MMKTLKIKVCGMRDPENTAGIAALRPDFIGLIFYLKSTRYVGEKVQPELLEKIHSPIQKVGVFVNEPIVKVLEISRIWGLDGIQLHGNETPDCCEQIKQAGYQVFKAFSLSNTFDFSILETYSGSCDYFLFDTKGQLPGGNGQKFNWSILENYRLNLPFFLSGGITPEDIESLQNFFHPRWFGIDINSGFETAPGIKDIGKTRKFIEEIRKYR
jgi:phosphoribosylanthranilate isomerase